MKLIKNSKGVSHVIGYILTLSLTAVIIAAASLTTNTIVTEKTDVAAEAYAENIANRIADAIINCYLIKGKYPEVNYSRTIELPPTLVGRSYYISVDNDNVYVKTRDGKVNVESTLYNVTNRLLTDISGTAYGGTGGLTISCDKYNYVHKFDFGTNDSKATLNYTTVTNFSIGDSSWGTGFDDWKYKTPIAINNPTVALTDYQVLVQLTEENFDYSHAKPNGSDLVFVLKGGNYPGDRLNYWIERWNPSDTHTSRIWVKILSIPAGDGHDYTAEVNISMYHGFDDGTTDPDPDHGSNGKETFIFFDNFSCYSSTDWSGYPKDSNISVLNDMLVLENGEEIRTKTQTVGSDPYVIETKAKALGANGGIREASMFVRTQGSVAPYSDDSYLLSSGDFDIGNQDNNLALIYTKTGSGWELPVAGNPAVNNDWNRLSFILNGADHMINRYIYKDFSSDGVTGQPVGSGSDGYVGLCVRNGDENSTAFYDWILVRQYAADGDEDGSVPTTIRVCGIHSKNFNWEDAPSHSTERLGIGNDIVYDDASSATFVIRGLTPGTHSLTFLLGDIEGENDPNSFVDNMEITIKDNAGTTTLGEITDIDCNPTDLTKKVFINNINVPDDGPGTGTIRITFNDDISIEPVYHWAVNQMTIQKGNRIINLEGGG